MSIAPRSHVDEGDLARALAPFRLGPDRRDQRACGAPVRPHHCVDAVDVAPSVSSKNARLTPARLAPAFVDDNVETRERRQMRCRRKPGKAGADDVYRWPLHPRRRLRGRRAMGGAQRRYSRNIVLRLAASRHVGAHPLAVNATRDLPRTRPRPAPAHRHRALRELSGRAGDSRAGPHRGDRRRGQDRRPCVADAICAGTGVAGLMRSAPRRTRRAADSAAAPPGSRPWPCLSVAIAAALFAQNTVAGVAVCYGALWFALNGFQAALLAVAPDRVPERLQRTRLVAVCCRRPARRPRSAQSRRLDFAGRRAILSCFRVSRRRRRSFSRSPAKRPFPAAERRSGRAGRPRLGALVELRLARFRARLPVSRADVFRAIRRSTTICSTSCAIISARRRCRDMTRAARQGFSAGLASR